MRKIHLYFAPLISDEFAYTLERIKEKMLDFELNEVLAYKAVREYNSDFFYCKQFGEVCAKHSFTCSKECKEYTPKNGKNGCCKYVGYLYVKGEELIISIA